MNVPKEFVSVVTNSVIFSKNKELLKQFTPQKVFALPRTLNNLNNTNELYPHAVEIHLTSRCQLKCENCSYSNRNTEKNDLSLDKVKEIHDFMRKKGAKSLIYSGGGDPLAWSENILDLFKSPQPFSQTIATNGVGLEKILYPECLENINIIQLSLRGYNADIFSKAANVSPKLYQKIHDNITNLLKLRAQLDKFPQLTAKLIVTQSNYTDIPLLFDYCVKLGFDVIVVKLSGNFEDGQDVELTHERTMFLYDKILNLRKNHTEYYVLDSIAESSSHSHYDFSKCWAVYLRMNMLVRPNGDTFLCTVSPCCDSNKIGNVFEQQIESFWNGPEHEKTIHKLCDDMRNGSCKIDICRHYRYNYFLNMKYEVENMVASSKEAESPRLL